MGEDKASSSSSRGNDGSSSSSPRPPISYSATALLALYKSPLVPAKLLGMKELSEWYGEYTDPPSSPPSRARDVHGASSRTNSSNNSGLSAGGRPNPFANFGRFGVDGGLEGEAIGGKLSGEKRRGGDRDAAPHLGGSSEGRRDNGRGSSRLNGADRETDASRSSKESTGFFSNERERSERMRARGGEVTVNGGRERRDENVKRDRRAPDEGGWRSVGGPGDRDRRLGRGHSNSTTNDSRDTRNDSRRDRDRDGEPRSGARRGQPAWMDDEPSASSNNNAPSWMDAPATGAMSFGSGNVIEKERASGGGGGGAMGGAGEGVDSIQAWKQQMKEMERREREKEEGISPTSLIKPVEPAVNGNTALPSPPEPTSSSVLTDLLGPGGSNDAAPKASVFGDLISGGGSSAAAGEGGRGGRGSRFAKFFDGKPPGVASPPPQAQPQPSMFESLMGVSAGSMKNAGSPGPSKEDADSMARLLGMLQVSSNRAHSPDASRNPPPSAPSPNVAAASPAPQQAVSPAPTSASSTSDRRQGGSSRFAFSQPSQQQQPQQGPPSSQQQQPLQSPPLQPYGGAPQSFGFPPQNQQSQQQAPQSPPDARSANSSLPAHSRSASTNHHTSPPLSHQQGPPSQHQQQPPFMQGPPAGPGNLPPHLHTHQGAASRPLPPLNNGQGRPDFSQQPSNGMPHIPMSMAPNGRPLPPQMFSPPPHPNDLPAHLRGVQPGGGPPLPPPQQYGRPPLPPGQQPPPFMMYGGPPPPHGMYGGPPPPQFRGGPPMLPQMGGGGGGGMGFGGPGVPDLMALLNSGGGGGQMRGPPPPQQSNPQQYMSMEQQRQ